MSTNLYTISDLAAEFDVTPRTIRFYEDQDLISPERDGLKRVYHERDRVRLKLIMRGKRLGFSLAEINELFQLYDSDPGEEGQLRRLLEVIKEKQDALKQQRKDIDLVLKEMEEVAKRAKKTLKAMTKA